MYGCRALYRKKSVPFLRSGFFESSCSERSGKEGGRNARKCSREMLLHAQLQQASNNRFAPSARNGKCISVDRAQTKGRTFARGLSLSRFLPFRAVLPSGVSFHLAVRPVLLSRVTLARQIPVLELSKD